MQWFGAQVTKNVKGMTRRRLELAGRFAQNEIRKAVSKVGKGGQKGRDAKGKFTKAKRSSSPPGDYPFKQTGFFRSNINTFFDAPRFRQLVGVAATAFYGRFLEFGTKHMDPRPWLYRTLRRIQPQIKSILGKGKP